ncbi:MAG TPA: type III pantothenate kinase [Phycisphaerales bacterium]|nr:type III pantothenate kinase [Phycisphaerales bacterium]
MVINSSGEPSLLAIAVGNTRTSWAMFRGRESQPPGAEPNAGAGAALAGVVEEANPGLVALASVNGPVADALAASLAESGFQVLRLGRDVAPPLRHSLEDASTLGIDRALNAVAAFDLVGAACAIIDAGTAITVDFIDGEGTFHGGGIAPGVNMMLRALHDHTAALPLVSFEAQEPSRGPFGKDTRHAMQLGAAAAARGLVRDLVERYAEAYEAYPRVIATGGDAAPLFDDDGLVERIIPELQLIGIQRTIERALTDRGAE